MILMIISISITAWTGEKSMNEAKENHHDPYIDGYNICDRTLDKSIVIKTNCPCDGKGVFILKSGINTEQDVYDAIDKAFSMNAEYRKRNAP